MKVDETSASNAAESAASLCPSTCEDDGDPCTKKRAVKDSSGACKCESVCSYVVLDPWLDPPLALDGCTPELACKSAVCSAAKAAEPTWK
ncbi:MAG: hypothetical protein RL701_563 [Pseudomonadota bacterium]